MHPVRIKMTSEERRVDQLASQEREALIFRVLTLQKALDDKLADGVAEAERGKTGARLIPAAIVDRNEKAFARSAAAHKHSLDAATQEMNNQKSIAETAARQIEDLTKQIVEITQRHTQIVHAKAEADRALAHAKADADQALEQMRIQLNAVRSSTSWRVTRPLRGVMRILRATRR